VQANLLYYYLLFHYYIELFNRRTYFDINFISELFAYI